MNDDDIIQIQRGCFFHIVYNNHIILIIFHETNRYLKYTLRNLFCHLDIRFMHNKTNIYVIQVNRFLLWIFKTYQL